MSRKLQVKNKDLVNLEVVTADNVWDKDHKSFKKGLIMAYKKKILHSSRKEIFCSRL